MDLFEEVNEYVLYLKRKMLIYVAIIFIRLSSSEKKPMTDYIIECQMSFLQNHKNVSFVLKQKLLTFLQQNLFFKLQFNSNANKLLLTYSEEIKHQGNDLFNFNVLTRPFVKNGPKQIDLEDKNKGYKQIEHKIKNSTVVNIRFIQSLLTLKSLLDKKPETHLSKLHSLKKCTKTLNNSSEKNLYENLAKCKNKDSGISLDCSENEWHDVISSNVTQFILQTSDTDCLLLESARNVITFIKYEVQQDALNHFYSWSGSLIENAFSTLMALSESHKYYFDIICKFICSTVHEIWENEKLGDTPI
uniref:Uncharacterized protein n=1 Tax=Clastoptera arizonana TaxID=38151 RepID=A0A1B6DMC7_9HEMI